MDGTKVALDKQEHNRTEFSYDVNCLLPPQGPKRIKSQDKKGNLELKHTMKSIFKRLMIYIKYIITLKKTLMASQNNNFKLFNE